MKHETTINELAAFAGLFSAVDHITVPETNPDTNITEEVTLPPPLIRRTQRRDDTTLWILTPPGIHERIFVADHAPITVYLKDPTPAPAQQHQATVHQQDPAPQQAAVHQPPAPAPPAPGGWPPQQPASPVSYPPHHQPPTVPPPATPHRPAAPWTTQQPHN
ncbi:hypothetical protein [Streptomyces solaniscabiei]|uniref:hypothetical protein n=2 Tax=Streptomyces solaniscabiei TaxID=2683255 RepID=UPI001CE3259A|nr:hypothetical protein [Streptomyces solaniscabiei]